MDAHELLFEYLSLHGGCGQAQLDDLCALHPPQASELRQVYEDLERARDFLGVLDDTDAPSDGAAGERPRGRDALSGPQALSQLTGRTGPKQRFVRAHHGNEAEKWDPQLRRVVNLHVAPGASPGALETLARARSLSRIEHPSIPPVHELGMIDGHLFFAYRHTAGKTLGDVLEGRESEEPGLRQTHALRMLIRASDAVEHAHSKGVVHGALDSTSILAGDHGEVYVLGWERAGIGPSEVHDRLALGRLLRPLAEGAAKPELQAIERKASALPPEGYTRVAELADDLRAFEAGKVVGAYRAGTWRVLRMWAARHRLLAGSLAATVTLSLLVLALYVMSVRQDRLLAEAALGSAQAERDRAEAAARLAHDRAVEIELSTLPLVAQTLTADAAELWPPAPARLEEMRDWLAEARPLESSLHRLEQKLSELRSRAIPLAVETRAKDRLTHPLSGRLEEQRARLQRQKSGLERLAEQNRPDLVAIANTRADWTRAEIDRLELRVQERLTYEFGDDDRATRQERSWRAIFTDLDRFIHGDAPGPGQDLMFHDTLAGVERRVEFAERLDEIETSPAGTARWVRALDEIRSPAGAYGGLHMVPQAGLIPLDQDEASGLWEFWHVSSGQRPERSRDGGWRIGPETGIVLVLIPGGTIVQGAQRLDPGAPKFDAQASDRERPGEALAVDAFFISKYEMTQSQWRRIWGTNPSQYTAGNLSASWTSPVERVDRRQCTETLRRLGLALPSEAQWDLAVRGSPGAYRRFGDFEPVDLLEARENLRDQAFLRVTGGSDETLPWDDSFPVHAPVGSFEPGPHGLHDMLGNVREWCSDAGGSLERSALPGDGRREGPSLDAVARGGSFLDLSPSARASARWFLRPTRSEYYLGCRPARELRP